LPIFLPKFGKSAQNSDHNIDPGKEKKLMGVLLQVKERGEAQRG
jgi:hypothetical protein